ncbi:hypothetical protein HDU93_007390 [Gonapodya sp. JEL0774]|nr:hypothetical protein HDU93_007390 [Gonapodya sp. JEL0774]
MIEDLPYRGTYTYNFLAQFVMRVDEDMDQGYAKTGPRLSIDWIELGGKRFTPADGASWEEAKVFVLHGSFTYATWFSHSRIHFPLDAFNALARSTIPRDGVIGQLLRPHLTLHVELDDAVLYGVLSPLASEKAWLPYNSLALSRPDHFKILNETGCPTPVTFRGPLTFDENFRYGRWLASYYQIVLKMVRQAINGSVSNNETEIRNFFMAMNKVAPFFPTGTEFASDPNILVYSVANFIFAVSFWHSGDHYSTLDYAGNTAIVHRPRRPGPHEASLSAKEFASGVQSVGDWFKQFQLMGVYGSYIPNPLQNLTMMKAKYHLDDVIENHDSSFKDALLENEQRLIAAGDNIMPLSKVVTCIAF